MDFLAKRLVISWMFIILVILNICALGTVWYQQLRGPRGGPPPRPGERALDVARFLQRELGLTGPQEEKVKGLQAQFFHRADVLQREIDVLRKENLEELRASAPDTRKADECAGRIGMKEKEKEQLLFAHFLDIKKACDAGQQKKFDGLLFELLRMMGPPERQGPPGPPGRHGPPGPRGERRPPDRDDRDESVRP